MDGEWEAPHIPNPACQIGCGEWKPPMIDNPKYKGIWRPPMIDHEMCSQHAVTCVSVLTQCFDGSLKHSDPV